MTLQGHPSALRPRFCALITKIQLGQVGMWQNGHGNLPERQPNAHSLAVIKACLVVRRDDDLRVAQSRDPLAHGEAAVRLLDERGQVVDARPPQLLQDLDLVQWGGKLLAILHERCQTAEDRDNKDFALRLKLSEKEKFGGRRAVS